MADIFAVIADPTRRELLRVLLERSLDPGTTGDISVGEMVGLLEASQPTVSKHLRVLREAGLVRVREEGQHRFYAVETEPLDAVDAWLVPFLGTADLDPVLVDDGFGENPDEDARGGELIELATAAGAVSPPRIGQAVPAPLRRAAENLPDAIEVGSTLGRAVAEAQARASSILGQRRRLGQARKGSGRRDQTP